MQGKQSGGRLSQRIESDVWKVITSVLAVFYTYIFNQSYWNGIIDLNKITKWNPKHFDWDVHYSSGEKLFDEDVHCPDTIYCLQLKMGLIQSNNWFKNVDRERPGPAIVTSRRSAKNMIHKKKCFL